MRRSRSAAVVFVALLAWTASALPPVVGQAQNQPPTVDISAPLDGATVTGPIDIAGTASDPDGNVTLVEVRVDEGTWEPASGNTTWVYAWDSAAVGDGPHSLSARAFDGLNHSAIATRAVTVENQVDPPPVPPPDPPPEELPAQGNETPNDPPSIVMDEPDEGETVAGVVVVEGTAADSDGTITSVEVSVDGGPWQLADGTTSWSWSWDTRPFDDGIYTLLARATDNASAIGTTSNSVFVENQGEPPPPANKPPTVTIARPREDAKVNGTVDIEGTAADPEGKLEGVEVRVDSGPWLAALGRADWKFTWDSRATSNGTHAIQVRSYDGELRSEVAVRTVRVDNEPAQKANRAPVVTIDSPPAGVTVNGSIVISGSASDPDKDPISFVEVSIPGQFQGRRATGTQHWSFGWDTSVVPPGHYIIVVRATDDRGAEGDETLTLVVEHKDAAPLLLVESPQPGDQVGSELRLEGTATDDDASELRLDVRIDNGPWTSYDVQEGEPFSLVVKLGDAEPGEHRLSVRAADGDQVSEIWNVQLVRAGAAPEGPAEPSTTALFLVVVALVGLAVGTAFVLSKWRAGDEGVAGPPRGRVIPRDDLRRRP